jgi:phosphatidylinositol phospholipase C delta
MIKIPFVEVCQAIGAAVQSHFWPTWVSLECHVDAKGQRELVDIMVQTWGNKLVTSAADNGDGHMPPPRDLKGRILVMVS